MLNDLTRFAHGLCFAVMLDYFDSVITRPSFFRSYRGAGNGFRVALRRAPS